MTGKYPDSQSPTRNRIAYSCDTLVTDDVQKVRIDHMISRLGIKIEGRTLVASITAGICPTTYPAVNTLLVYVSSLPYMLSDSFIWIIL